MIRRDKVLITLLVFSCSIGSSFLLTGQDIPQGEEITVVAPYQPTIGEVYKIPLAPEMPVEKTDKPDFNYGITDKIMIHRLLPEPLIPAKVKTEAEPVLHKNLIKAGFGTLTTPYFEFFANSLQSKKSAFGVHLKHLSSGGKIKDYAFPGFSNNLAEIYGKQFFPSHTLSANVAFSRKMNHYYGFVPDSFPNLSFSKNDIRQLYNKISLNTAFESNYTKSDALHHSFGLGYYYLFDNYQTTEHNIRFDAALHKNTSLLGFTRWESLGVNVGSDLWFMNDSLQSETSGIITVLPHYRIKFAEYLFSFGVNASIETGEVSYMYFYPDIKAEVNVIADVLITYAGITGYMEKNSFDKTRQQNPFISPVFQQEFTYVKFAQFGGLKGRIGKRIDYNLNFYNFSVDNMPLFVADTVSDLHPGVMNQFAVVYDKAKHSRIQAAFTFHHTDRLTLSVNGSYNSYFMDKEEEAWHKPAVTSSFSAHYNLNQNLLLKTEVFANSSVYAKEYENGEIIARSLKGFSDISLGAEYRFNKPLTAFLDLNNILNQQYYRWHNYPSYRFNLLAGISYSF